MVAVGLVDGSDIDAGFDQGVSGAFDILDVKDQFDQRLACFLTFSCRMQHQDQAAIRTAQFDDAITVPGKGLIAEMGAVKRHHGINVMAINYKAAARTRWVGRASGRRHRLAAIGGAIDRQAVDHNPAIGQQLAIIFGRALWARASGGKAVHCKGYKRAKDGRVVWRSQ